MPVEPQPKPSFTPYRKWGMGLNMTLLVALVLAVVVMINYLGRQYFLRIPVTARGKTPLSPLTLRFLGSLTNQIRVTVYYDKDEPLFELVTDLLNEYRLANRKILIQTVDYKRDPAAAQQLQAKYPFLATPSAKDLIIFDGGPAHVKAIPGQALGTAIIEATGDTNSPYRRKLVAFNGERAFTALLMAVTTAKPFTAYFLQGHGEHAIDDGERGVAAPGYRRFADLLSRNIVTNSTIQLLGTNGIPADCNLLVLAGPQRRLEDTELKKIDHYLTEGGRLLTLFNFLSITNQTGLETILAKWGVAVGQSTVADPPNTPERESLGAELIVSAYGSNALVNPLVGYGLDLIAPRPIGRFGERLRAADAPHVEQLIYSGSTSFLLDNPTHPQNFPLAVAVEKGAIKGVVTERGTTRIVVLGDSFCFSNQLLDSPTYKNQDFAAYLINWLLDRPQLLEGVGPQAVKEYKLVMTKAQMQSAEWLLLGGLPGGVLVLGGLVWLRRRR